MTTRQISIDEDDFQAFVDGQLPPDRRRAVMAYLAAPPEEAARMSDYRTLTEEMHLLYDEVLYEPLPAAPAGRALSRPHRLVGHAVALGRPG